MFFTLFNVIKFSRYTCHCLGALVFSSPATFFFFKFINFFSSTLHFTDVTEFFFLTLIIYTWNNWQKENFQLIYVWQRDYGRRIHYKLSTQTPHYNDFTHKFIYPHQTNVFADVIFAPLHLSFYPSFFFFVHFFYFF